MMRHISKSSWALMLLVSFFFAACNSGKKIDLEKEKQMEKQFKEAQELAEKIKSGDIFNEELALREKLLKPENVCTVVADFSSNDFGPSPDFRGDGESVIYNDRSAVVHYYYFKERRFYRIGANGRNPSFGMMLANEGDIKYIYESYKIRENSWEGDSTGILMNTEINWMNDPTLLINIPAEEPFLVNNDKNIIYKKGQECFTLDETMSSKPISKEEYERLRDGRYIYENTWKVVNSYKGIDGVWITDSAEKNWNQLRDIKGVKTLKIIPSKYNIYVWGDGGAGICLIRTVDLQMFAVELNASATASIGDLFDVYEKEVSPISNEIIGFKDGSYKGTLRVTKESQGKYICEPQTRLSMQGFFAGDAVVLQNNTSLLGRIL